ncbi:MAG TPA: hypothetical protein VIY47_17180 [Ignavibacteriaceae bacterium]
MKVFIYFNLHKQCLSLKAMNGPHKGRVVAHANSAELSEVFFKVSESGRQRVIREKRKNVHAGIVGTLEKYDLVTKLLPFDSEIGIIELTDEMEKLTYNPYQYHSFVKRSDKTPVDSAKKAFIVGRDLRIS